MGMTESMYTVRFVTPAFLGDADQRGRWRTPPFKALIRQWWRVATAGDKEIDYDWEKLRKKEGELFGHAWLKEDGSEKKWAGTSRVRIRLDNWRPGQLANLRSSGPVCHPEVNHPRLPACPDKPKGRLIETNLYLGFGVVGTRGLDKSPAIGPAEENTLTVLYPEANKQEINDTMTLINAFGTLGARSRNGWGSVALTNRDTHGPGLKLYSDYFLKPFKRDLASSLSFKFNWPWPHAIGEDEKGLLIWLTAPQDGFAQVLRVLAETKIAYRTAIPVPGGHALGERHFLGYPVTNHPVGAWGNASRLANQLRFKVLQDHNGKYRGVIYHIPCGLPNELIKPLKERDRQFVKERQLDVWRKVHGVLDSYKGLTRVKGGV